MAAISDVRDLSALAYGFIASKVLFAALNIPGVTRLVTARPRVSWWVSRHDSERSAMLQAKRPAPPPSGGRLALALVATGKKNRRI